MKPQIPCNLDLTILNELAKHYDNAACTPTLDALKQLFNAELSHEQQKAVRSIADRCKRSLKADGGEESCLLAIDVLLGYIVLEVSDATYLYDVSMKSLEVIGRLSFNETENENGRIEQCFKKHMSLFIDRFSTDEIVYEIDRFQLFVSNRLFVKLLLPFCKEIFEAFTSILTSLSIKFNDKSINGTEFEAINVNTRNVMRGLVSAQTKVLQAILYDQSGDESSSRRQQSQMAFDLMQSSLFDRLSDALLRLLGGDLTKQQGLALSCSHVLVLHTSFIFMAKSDAVGEHTVKLGEHHDGLSMRLLLEACLHNDGSSSSSSSSSLRTRDTKEYAEYVLKCASAKHLGAALRATELNDFARVAIVSRTLDFCSASTLGAVYKHSSRPLERALEVLKEVCDASTDHLLVMATFVGLQSLMRAIGVAVAVTACSSSSSSSSLKYVIETFFRPCFVQTQAYWDTPFESVGYEARTALGALLMALKKIAGGGGGDDDDEHRQFLSEIVRVLMRGDATRKAKYGGLLEVATHVGGSLLIEVEPDFVQQTLAAGNVKHVRHLCAQVLERTLRSVASSSLSERWLPQVFEWLRKSQYVDVYAAVELSTVFVRTAPHCVEALLTMLNDDAAGGTAARRQRALAAIVIVLFVAMKERACAFDRMSQLVAGGADRALSAALQHEDAFVRMTAFDAFYLSLPSTAAGLERWHYRFLTRLLVSNLKSNSAALRHHYGVKLKRVLTHVRDSVLSAGRKRRAGAERRVQVIREAAVFLSAAIQRLFTALYPGAAYPMRAFAIELVLVMCEVFERGADAQTPLSYGAVPRATYNDLDLEADGGVPALRLYTSDRVVRLLRAMVDSHDHVVVTAGFCLVRFPWSLSGLSDLSGGVSARGQFVARWVQRLLYCPRATAMDAVGGLLLLLTSSFGGGRVATPHMRETRTPTVTYMHKRTTTLVDRSAENASVEESSARAAYFVLEAAPPREARWLRASERRRDEAHRRKQHDDVQLHVCKQLLDEQVRRCELASRDLLASSRCAPMHTPMCALRAIVESLDFVALLGDNQRELCDGWRLFFEEMNGVFERALTIVLPLMVFDAPEGALPSEVEESGGSGAGPFMAGNHCVDQIDNGDAEGDEFDEKLGIDGDVYNGAPAQLYSSHCWLTLKEWALMHASLISHCLGAAHRRVLDCGADALVFERLLSFEFVESSGARMLDVLMRVRHKGAIETTNLTLRMIASHMLRCTHAPVSRAVGVWLHRLMSYAVPNADSAEENDDAERSAEARSKLMETLGTVRRSGGLPFAVCSILSAELIGYGERAHLLSNVASVIERLMSVVRTDDNEQEAVASRVHALNVLRSILRESALNDLVAPFLGACIECVWFSYDSFSWEVRNSASMLYSVVLARVCGSERNGNSQWRKPTFATLIGRYPSLFDAIRDRLSVVESKNGDAGGATSSTSTSLYAVLLLLGQLAAADTDRSEWERRAALLVPAVMRCAAHRDENVRVMVARAMVPLVAVDELDAFLRTCFALLRAFVNGRAVAHNEAHGALLLLFHSLSTHLRPWLQLDAGEDFDSRVSTRNASLSTTNRRAVDVWCTYLGELRSVLSLLDLKGGKCATLAYALARIVRIFVLNTFDDCFVSEQSGVEVNSLLNDVVGRCLEALFGDYGRGRMQPREPLALQEMAAIVIESLFGSVGVRVSRDIDEIVTLLVNHSCYDVQRQSMQCLSALLTVSVNGDGGASMSVTPSLLDITLSIVENNLVPSLFHEVAAALLRLIPLLLREVAVPTNLSAERVKRVWTCSRRIVQEARGEARTQSLEFLGVSAWLVLQTCDESSQSEFVDQCVRVLCDAIRDGADGRNEVSMRIVAARALLHCGASIYGGDRWRQCLGLHQVLLVDDDDSVRYCAQELVLAMELIESEKSSDSDSVGKLGRDEVIAVGSPYLSKLYSEAIRLYSGSLSRVHLYRWLFDTLNTSDIDLFDRLWSCKQSLFIVEEANQWREHCVEAQLAYFYVCKLDDVKNSESLENVEGEWDELEERWRLALRFIESYRRLSLRSVQNGWITYEESFFCAIYRMLLHTSALSRGGDERRCARVKGVVQQCFEALKDDVEHMEMCMHPLLCGAFERFVKGERVTCFSIEEIGVE